MPFAKGQSGNPKGRPKIAFSMADAFRQVLQEEEGGEPNSMKVARKAVKLAIKGDVSAMKLLANYVDGMPTQKVDAEVVQRSFIMQIEEALGDAMKEDDADGDGPEA